MPDRRLALLAGAIALPLAGCAQSSARLSREDTAAQVRAAEESFAATMARRDLTAFGQHLCEDAVFLAGGKPLRGRAAVLQAWSRFFTGAAAPFSWTPDTVEVLQPGQFGYTEGPVTSAAGVNVARFYSVWRHEADGRWRVLLDNGYDLCKK